MFEHWMSRPEAARDLPEHSSLIITVLDLRGPSGMLPAPALLRDNRTTSLVLLPRLRAPGRGSDKSVPYAISNRLAAPPPKRFGKRGEPRAEPPICDPSCAGGCQFNSPALGLAPALFARARLAAGCRNDRGAGRTPALNATMPCKEYAASDLGNYCDFEAFPGRSPPARPPTLLVSASPPGW